MSAVYVACAFSERESARRWAEQVRSMGHTITSSWLNVVETSDADLTEAQRAAAWQACLADVSRSDLLIALPHLGTPRATLVEIGVAQALGKPIVWTCVGNRGRCIADGHPKVVRVDLAAADEWLPARELRAAIQEAVRR